MAITQAFESTGISDLLAQIRFDSDNGRIWLNEQRMVLLHSGVLGQLRKELVETLGIERTRGFLMRFGYNSGWRDAELVAKVRPNMSKEAAFFLGPQMHSVKGMVKATPVTLEMDMDTGRFEAEFDWFNSYEAEVHLQDFGPSKHPICWTLLGYASGYSSFFMGRNILFKETRCSGMGHEHCRIVGKPAEDWDDQQELERYLTPDPVAEELFSLQSQISELRDNFRSSDQSDDLLFNSVGQSAAFKNVCQMIRRASSSKVTVLLQGETGVGKEIVARGLHQSSDRADKAFVAVNCACIPPDLIEAELFGVEKGAYTGATQSREGKFERANGGTIFLDEVIELSPRAQASLLRVLQESEMERVGDTRTRTVDVRVVAAANEDLEQAVNDGRFRADLFFRLNVYPVQIPPLRERTEDIPLLVKHFLEKYHTLYNKQTRGVSDLAMQALMHYTWPGNIRELENMIERGVILTDNNQSIDLNAFFPSLSEPSHPLNSINRQGVLAQEIATREQPQALSTDAFCEHLLDQGLNLDQLEEKLIRRAMERANGNVSQAARLLDMTRPQLAYRLKKLELD